MIEGRLRRRRRRRGAAHRRWPRRRGSTSTTASLVDEQPARPAPRASSRPATSPTPMHPFFGTRRPGRALGQRAQPGPGRGAQHARHATSPTTSSRTSSPTSTTSAWSTRATPPTGTRSCSAAIRRAASSSPSGSTDGRVVAGMNVNVWDVTERDPGADPLARPGRPRPPRRPRRPARGRSPSPRHARRVARARSPRPAPPAACRRRRRRRSARTRPACRSSAIG